LEDLKDRRSMLSLLDLLRRIDAGETTPEAAIRQAHLLIAERDEELRAFAYVDGSARTAADGPLRGVAVGLKDIIDTADMPTEMGSPIYAGWRPRADAAIVSVLRRAGATVIGKTATTPLAFIDPTVTRNPRDPAHTPGGSSSGSAAAVGAGLIPLAVGTQTAGSVIRPASFCGVASVKPSYRLLPTVGVKDFAWTLDTLGLFAATVADAGYALAAVTGRDDLRVDGRALAAPHIGVVTQDFAGAPEDDSAAALDAAAQMAERAGAVVRLLELPPELGEAFRVHQPLQDFEARQALAWEYDNHRDLIGPLLRQALDAAQTLSAEVYDEARRVAHQARLALRQVFQGVDVLLTFSAPGAAPQGFGSTGNARFNKLWTLMGTPCVNIPGLENPHGMPVGVQVIAPFGDDAQALAAAAFVEEAIRRHR
jgi:Asp-tRNA(Asn)/Glu-tRNA(Gln) amidotransferase A subunit family amidase